MFKGSAPVKGAEKPYFCCIDLQAANQTAAKGKDKPQKGTKDETKSFSNALSPASGTNPDKPDRPATGGTQPNQSKKRNRYNALRLFRNIMLSEISHNR